MPKYIKGILKKSNIETILILEQDLDHNEIIDLFHTVVSGGYFTTHSDTIDNTFVIIRNNLSENILFNQDDEDIIRILLNRD